MIAYSGGLARRLGLRFTGRRAEPRPLYAVVFLLLTSPLHAQTIVLRIQLTTTSAKHPDTLARQTDQQVPLPEHVVLMIMRIGNRPPKLCGESGE